MRISDQFVIKISDVEMLRRKSLSLDKSPIDRSEKNERRSSVAAGILGYHERSPVHYHHDKSHFDRIQKAERRGSFSGSSPEIKERKGSIVQRWLKHISEAAKIAEGNKNRDSGKGRRIDLGASLPQSPPETEAVDESLDRTKEPDESKDGNDLDTSGTSQEGSESVQSDENSQSVTPTHASSTIRSDSGDHGRKSVTSSPSQKRKTEPLRLTTVENSLIHPSEVKISQKPVLTAEPVLTPLERLRLKDEAIRKALLEKQQLVADILRVPREEFDTMAEMAGEFSVDKEATELVLAAVSQANRLAALLNESLRVTEEEAVTVTSEVQPGCSPRGGRRKTRLPGVPAKRLQGISTSLNSQLTQLLKIIKDRDEERERLRKELQRSREQIHVLHEAHRKSPRSPSHSTLDESAEQESGDKIREQADDASKSTNDGNQQPWISTNREPKFEATNEVFVDALSGDSETLETNSEPPETITETDEDPPA